jgi:nitrite reductase/ring-hydroxylating ferredoxin subunit
MTDIDLCALKDIDQPGSRGFSIDTAGGKQDIFVVRSGTAIFGYRNSCPHTGGPLDWVQHRFLSIDNKLIQCATHDALFNIHDGLCIKGPCAGKSLTPVAIEIVAGRVKLRTDASGRE